MTLDTNRHAHLMPKVGMTEDRCVEAESIRIFEEAELECPVCFELMQKPITLNCPGLPGRLNALSVCIANRFSLALLYGRAGCLTARNGGFRAGGHSGCKACFVQWVSEGKPACPECRSTANAAAVGRLGINITLQKVIAPMLAAKAAKQAEEKEQVGFGRIVVLDCRFR